jgi:aspartate racemase
MSHIKTLGLIGGMAWESTVEYYRILNELVQQHLGDWSSAPLLLYSVNFQEIIAWQNAGRWDLIANKLKEIAKKLEGAGAEGLLLCSNTIHKVADEIQQAITIPVLHVVDALGENIKVRLSAGDLKIGLLGTKFTMEGGFYADRLRAKFGIQTVLPSNEQREFINHSIYNELAKGVFKPETKSRLHEIIHSLIGLGAKGIVLGCTELPLIIDQDMEKILFFDTLNLHLESAVKFMLNLV